ncbi:3-hydroxyacyl-ACP dehydratase FabZ [Candidatus Bipolaricaulota bacterium]|nr:3-hydroxyacyl-ACP dehydratase FabZ [Candidatus Bipolaricaulota bacterium]
MTRDIEAVRRALPLRFPYLMVDRVLEEGEGRVVAVKNVTIGEPVFQGHFPSPHPAVMPGTLILEAMAQTVAFLLLEGEEEGLGFLVGVDKARFRRKVVPGDQLRLEARLLKRKRGLVRAEVRASVSGETAATAIISLVAAEGEKAEREQDQDVE